MLALVACTVLSAIVMANSLRLSVSVVSFVC